MAGRRGRKAAEIILADDERETLQRYVRRGSTSQQLVMRSRIVLACAEGKTNRAIVEELGTCYPTVTKWRRRFLELRMKGLLDAPRCGAPRQIGDDKVEEIVVRTLETTPKGATHWSTRTLAKQVGVSREAVGRIWRAFGLKPHLADTFQLSRDPQFVEKVRDVVGLYLDPPDNALVLSTDEKTQVQALDRTQPILPLQPGRTERRTPEYERHGTTSVFAALDVATGNVIGKCYRQHRATEFIQFLRVVDKTVAPDLSIHMILDNLATHKTPAVQRWLVRHPRFHLHFTPTHSSWLNQVERWFGLLTDKQIKRGAHCSVPALERAIYEFIEAHNDDPKPFRWTKSADEILDRVAGFCRDTLMAHGKDE
jgi:transposase